MDCNECVHNEVCRFKKQHETIASLLENVIVNFSDEDKKIPIRRSSDNRWLEPLEPVCIYYEERCPQ